MTARRPSLADLRHELLRWYRRSHRDLPWRRTRNPYHVWVSEIMLQQTRVEAVVPHYERFLARFPTLQDLARADEEQVLTAWAGLGYYRRARLLHAAARQVDSVHGGVLPSDPATLRRLPGIGRYTAGALASICFDRAEPVVDGNVIRVLTRLLRLRGDPTRAPLVHELWSIAGELVPGPSPGDVNQALMELGATLCLPVAAARCEQCPLAHSCLSRRSGEVASLPQLPERTAPTPEIWLVALARRRGRFLLRQRLEGAVLQGMWELPTLEVANQATTGRAGRQLLSRHLGRSLGLDAVVGPELVRHRQVITHRRIEFVVYEVRVDGRVPRTLKWKWLLPAQIEVRPHTTATRRILQRLDHAGSSSASAQVATASRSSSTRRVNR